MLLGLGSGGIIFLPGVSDEESHLLGGDLLGSNDQIALVLSVLVVDSDNELAVSYDSLGIQ